MKNIHLIPTSQFSKLAYYQESTSYNKPILQLVNMTSSDYTYQYLYITNDEEPKDGEWVYHPEVSQEYTKVNLSKEGDERYTKGQHIAQGVYKHKPTTNEWYKKERKIILTTDPNLIIDGIQSINDEFLVWFVNNSSCEEVKISHELNINGKNGLDRARFIYKIIIPIEESIQEIVGYRLKPSIDRMMVDGILKNAMPNWNDEDKSVYFIRGHVGGSLVAKLRELQVLDLWFTPIYENEEVKSDWVKEHHLDYYHKEGIMSNKPKQETVEEAAENYINLNKRFADTEKAFITGAKWMQERMYSEEDLKNAFDSGREFDSLDGIVDIHIILPMGGDMSDLQPLYPTFEDWFKNLKSKNENI